MKLYTTIPVFSRSSGKPNGFELQKTNKLICDYSGEILDLDDIEDSPQYAIKVKYNHGCEEIYYYDKGQEFFTKLGYEYSSLFDSPFHFQVIEDYFDRSIQLAEEWLKGHKTKNDYFYKCLTIEEAMRLARIRTIKKLLKEEKIKIEELGLQKTI